MTNNFHGWRRDITSNETISESAGTFYRLQTYIWPPPPHTHFPFTASSPRRPTTSSVHKELSCWWECRPQGAGKGRLARDHHQIRVLTLPSKDIKLCRFRDWRIHSMRHLNMPCKIQLKDCLLASDVFPTFSWKNHKFYPYFLWHDSLTF